MKHYQYNYKIFDNKNVWKIVFTVAFNADYIKILHFKQFNYYNSQHFVHKMAYVTTITVKYIFNIAVNSIVWDNIKRRVQCIQLKEN